MKKTTFVIFGITGDLAKRKLIPAIFCLDKDKKFEGEFEVIGVGRKNISEKEFKEQLRDSLEKFGNCPKKKITDKFLNKIKYQKIDFGDSKHYLN